MSDDQMPSDAGFGIGDLATLMLEHFQRMSEDEQKETVLLAANARYLLRMTENADTDTVRIVRAALTRGIPSLGGEKLCDAIVATAPAGP